MEKILDTKLIKLDFNAKDKLDVIEQLAKLIEHRGRLKDFDTYIEKVLEREAIFPTAIGYGVVIPHGKSNTVKHPTVAFGRLNKSVKWSEKDDIRYIFLIAVPEDETEDTHLKILAKISRKLMQEEFRNQIKLAKTSNEIINAIMS